METMTDDELLFFGSVETNFAYHFGSVHLSHIDELQFHTDKDKFTLHSVTSNAHLWTRSSLSRRTLVSRT